MVNMGPFRKRIYLGNLPFDASEEEVTEKFRKYGKVVNVEMKYQSDVSFDVGLPCYAFLDLDINDNDLNSCFSKIKSKKWRGNLIKIEIAKESFLSRLEKERQSFKHSSESFVAPPGQIKKIDGFKGSCIKFEDNGEQEKDNSFNISNDCNENSTKSTSADEETNIPQKRKKAKKSRVLAEPISTAESSKEPNVVDKFESFSDVWKDEPLRENETNFTQKKKDKKAKRKKEEKKDDCFEKKGSEEILNAERNRIAEERRLKSLEDRKNSVKQQKDAVKLALSSVDSKKKNNRLTFKDDDNDVDEPTHDMKDNFYQNKLGKHSNKNSDLFADHITSDEDEGGISFGVKKQFEGRQGQKLLELKSKYGNDSRFALDERFYDSDNDIEKDVVANSEEMSNSEEVKKQLEILKGIVGENLPRGTKKVDSQAQKPGENFMLRFDPTVADHRKFELSNEDRLKALATVQKEKKKRKHEQEAPAVEVSKEKYYKVADTLKESLSKNTGGGFSLLEMFGGRKDTESDKHEIEMGPDPVSTERKKEGRDWKSNRSVLDSEAQEPAAGKAESIPVCASWGETFFYKPDDPRLFEGIKFFKTMSADLDFRQLRYELRDICKHKVETARKKANESRGGGWHGRNGR